MSSKLGHVNPEECVLSAAHNTAILKPKVVVTIKLVAGFWISQYRTEDTCELIKEGMKE